MRTASRKQGRAPGVDRRRNGRPRALRTAGRAAAVAVLAGGLAAGCGSETSTREGERRARETGYRGIVLAEPLPKPAFTLTDTGGEPFAFREETDGYATLLFFGYTHCPDICPVHMANLAAVLQDLPYRTRQRIRVVFVTTDPERDTPERLRAWLDRFDRGFVGLRGEPSRVNEIQARLGLPPTVREERGGGEYRVGHASQVIAFTPDGEGRVAYPFGTRQADWAHDLPRLAGDAGGGTGP